MNKFLENIKTFGYKVPEDPEQLLYDFYFMAGWMPHSHEDKVIDFVFKEALKDCTAALQEHMLVAIYWSLAAEIRHIFDYSRLRPGRVSTEAEVGKLPKDVKLFLKKYFEKVMKYGSEVLGALDPDRVKTLAKDNRLLKHNLLKTPRGLDDPQSRNAAYQESFLALESARKAMRWSKLEAVQALRYLYGDVQWDGAYGGGDGSYGGKAWASIADAYIKLARATTPQERMVYIDHAYDLQHNTGSVFTKVKNYYKNGGLSWLYKALDWKRDTKDVRSYYDKVSSSLRPVVAWVAKDKYGLTMEDYGKPRAARSTARRAASIESDSKLALPKMFYINMAHLSQDGRRALMKKLIADVLPRGSRWESAHKLDDFSSVPVDDDVLILTKHGESYKASMKPLTYIGALEDDQVPPLTEEEILQGKYDRAPDETTYKGGSVVTESVKFHEFFKYREAVTMAQVGGKLLANAPHFAKNMSLIQDFRISDLPEGVSTPEDLMYDLATSKARGRVLSDNVVEQLKNLQAKHGNLKAGISAWLKANPDANNILSELLRQGVTASTIQKADTGAVKRTGSAAQLQAVARR